MYAYEIPNLRFSLPAGADIARHRLITVNENCEGIQATAGATVIGASMNETKTGEVLELADGIVMVTAGGEVAPGAKVSADAEGKAVTASDGYVAGVAITGGNAGELISVKVN